MLLLDIVINIAAIDIIKILQKHRCGRLYKRLS